LLYEAHHGQQHETAGETSQVWGRAQRHQVVLGHRKARNKTPAEPPAHRARRSGHRSGGRLKGSTRPTAPFEVERCNVRIASDGLVEIIAAPCSKPRSQEINHVGMGRGNKGGRDHQSENEPDHLSPTQRPKPACERAGHAPGSGGDGDH
jgi:hypothetical protein